MSDWLLLFLANLALVKFIGIEQFSNKVSFRLFFKKINFSFLFISLLYALSYPLYVGLSLTNYSYFQPLIYVVVSYSCYWLLNFLKRHYDYRLVVNPSDLLFDFFYQTLIAGTFFFVFSLNLSFFVGFLAIATVYLSYSLAYILWMGIARKIARDVYSKPSLRYWAIYLSLLLLSLFFYCLVICQISNE